MLAAAGVGIESEIQMLKKIPQCDRTLQLRRLNAFICMNIKPGDAEEQHCSSVDLLWVNESPPHANTKVFTDIQMQ